MPKEVAAYLPPLLVLTYTFITVYVYVYVSHIDCLSNIASVYLKKTFMCPVESVKHIPVVLISFCNLVQVLAESRIPPLSKC